MMQHPFDAFTTGLVELSPDHVQLVRDALLRLESPALRAASDVEWRGFTMPFYPDAILVEGRCAEWPTDVTGVYFILAGHEVIPLDGRSQNIHGLNRMGALSIDEANAVPYLCFFCLFVHGDHGPWLIVDDPCVPWTVDREQRPVDREPLPGLERVLARPRQFGTDPATGAHRIAATVVYGDTVYVADFLVGSNGMIDMLRDDLLLRGLDRRVVFRPGR